MTGWPVRAGRLAVLLALLAGAAALVLGLATVRGWESVLAAALLRPVGAVSASESAAITWFQFDAQRAVGLAITPECSVALVLAPVLVLAAMLAGRRWIPLYRVFGGLAAAGAFIVAGNVVRIGTIAAMIDEYGIGVGYDLGHTVVGSLVSLAFVAAAVVVLFRIAIGGSRRAAVRAG